MTNDQNTEMRSQEARIEALETSIKELSYLLLKQQGVIKNLEHRLNTLNPKKRIRTIIWK